MPTPGPGEVAISQLARKNPLGTDLFIITDANNNTSGAVSVTDLQIFFQGDTGLPDAFASIKLTKAQLRAYTGALKRVVFLTDAQGLNLAVYRPGDITSPDTANTVGNPTPIIIDGSLRRYKLMDMIGLFALILESYQPENL